MPHNIKSKSTILRASCVDIYIAIIVGTAVEMQRKNTSNGNSNTVRVTFSLHASTTPL